MMYQLNNETANELESLGNEPEKGDYQVNCKFEKEIDELKKSVANYKEVMVEQFHIPEEVFFNSIPVNIKLLKYFIRHNGSELAAARIYLGKKSADKNLNDYEVLIIPARKVYVDNGKGGDSGERDYYYEDILPDNNDVAPKPVFLTVDCRRPPGCGRGAELG
ncbi:MAG: hypothetical protein M3Z92_07125 [Bacteroidota bacterium]|nr:hypothetical protein [Bacteroidota bacterium]MDQ6889086.1 hypothetical protein [Bacteroidota bacterium]